MSNKIRINSTISQESSEILKAISKDSNISKSKLIDIALQLLKEEYKTKKNICLK